MFFLISGAVLTPSFARPGAFLGKLGKRVVRLGLPVAAAAVIATVLLAAWPDAHLRAAALTGSAWLAMDSSGGAPTLAHLAREIGLDSLLLGYREATLFAPLAGQLPPMEHSLDAPFWSLHLELYGSLLVLCLVSLRTWSPWLHRAAIVAAAVLFGTQPTFLFVLGQLVSIPPRSGGVPRCISAAARHCAMRQQGTGPWRTRFAYRCVGRMAQQIINGRQVKVHLARVLRLEVVDLEIDDDEAAQAQVIEEEIEVEVLVADLEVILAADKGEAPAELKEKRTEIVQQTPFEFPLGNISRSRKKLEIVGVLE